MSNCYNLDGVKIELRKELNLARAYLAAWEAVQFVTKKDGTPFKLMSKNIVGATYCQQSFAMQAGENILRVTCFSEGYGYTHDEIPAYTFVKYLNDDEMKAKTQNYMPKETLLHQVYRFDLDDIKKAVAARVEHFRKSISALEWQIENADYVYNKFKVAYSEAVHALAQGSRKGVDSRLYYAVFETVKERFPFC